MHTTNDDEWRRPFNPVSGSTITVGTISKLADATAELRESLAALNAKLDDAVADLTKRVGDAAGLRAHVADAIQKVKAEDTKREADRASVLAWIKAQPNPAEYSLLARNNGICEAELRS
jgi:hypothetical protein